MSDKQMHPCSCTVEPAEEYALPGDRMRQLKGALVRSVFRIPGMDCPSEEQMIRMRLAAAPVAAMVFDLPGRSLVVDHTGDPAALVALLEPLGYGTALQESNVLSAGQTPLAAPDSDAEAKVLWILLAINAAMSVIEIFAGWWANSAGLLSDAADMLADAGVYGVALYAVGRTAVHKRTAAHLSGLLQLALALGVLTETGRRIITGSTPEGIAMIGISLLALAANIACLALLSRYRDRGVHMRASYIFSANDVLANLGVIVAGVLVGWMNSPWPDWVIGFGIGVMVLIGSIRILRLR